MRLENGKYLCTLCGAEVDVEPEDRPLVMIRAASGEPNMRVIMLADKQLHACPVNQDAE